VASGALQSGFCARNGDNGDRNFFWLGYAHNPNTDSMQTYLDCDGGGYDDIWSVGVITLDQDYVLSGMFKTGLNRCKRYSSMEADSHDYTGKSFASDITLKMILGFYVYNYGTNGYTWDLFVDWTFVRKWVSTEPVQSTWGSEQRYFANQSITYLHDILLKKTDQPKTYTTDILTKITEIPVTYTIDILLTAEGIGVIIPPSRLIWIRRKARLQGTYAIPIQEEVTVTGKKGIRMRGVLARLKIRFGQSLQSPVIIIQGKKGIRVDESVKLKGTFGIKLDETMATVTAKFGLKRIDESLKVSGKHRTLQQMSRHYKKLLKILDKVEDEETD
jgi:hypothetical protein